jgi:hypothetical protein
MVAVGESIPLACIDAALKGAASMDEELAALLLTTASQGQLMAWLTAEGMTEDDRRRAMECLAHLHRSRLLDVLEHMRRPADIEEWRLDHPSWSRVYGDLLPLIDDDAGKVISAVVVLGTGFWEYAVNDAFIAWCARDAKRIDGVLELEHQPDIPEFCFVAALVAGMQMAPATYLDTSVEYVLGARRSRMTGILAIRGMSVADATTVQRAVSILSDVLKDDHAEINDRSAALSAALELAQRCDGYLDVQVSGLVAEAIADKQAELLNACCNAIVRFGSQLRDSLLPFLLDALQCLDIDATTTRSSVDSVLYCLLTRGRKEEALSCLEALLRRSKADDPLDALGSTTHYLANAAAGLLPTVICRWLLTGDRTLCAAARHLLNSAGNQKLVFDFDPGNRDWPDTRTLYLARKAIGWLMPHATAPASFLVCLLRYASEDAGRELGQLLFDPLLVNYPLATRAYLDAVCPNLPAKAKVTVETVLATDNLYKQGIEDGGFVPELQPTERQRWIEHEKRAEEWVAARRKAEGKSVLAQMFTRQTLLYGTRAIGYVDDPGGETRRLDNRLGTISYTADNAMGWVYDPVGLDYMLRAFRMEQIPG